MLDGRTSARYPFVVQPLGGAIAHPVRLRPEHGEAYWLYVVESAGTDDASLARIQDPAGRAKTFTFDHGWREVAEADDDTKEHEE